MADDELEQRRSKGEVEEEKHEGEVEAEERKKVEDNDGDGEDVTPAPSELESASTPPIPEAPAESSTSSSSSSSFNVPITAGVGIPTLVTPEEIEEIEHLTERASLAKENKIKPRTKLAIEKEFFVEADTGFVSFFCFSPFTFITYLGVSHFRT